MRTQTLILALLALAACKKETPTVVYQAVPAETRNIVVSAQAAGAIQPDTTVEVKSKASGEILDMMVETGQLVQRGALMVQVDQRTPRNTLAQAEAQLEVARARLQNAQSQLTRANELFKSQSITQTEQEAAVLGYANAKAEVVGAEVAVSASSTSSSPWRASPGRSSPARCSSSRSGATATPATPGWSTSTCSGCGRRSSATPSVRKSW
mgnify:CR=1 FL=1